MNRKLISALLLVSTFLCGTTGALATDGLTVPAEDTLPPVVEETPVEELVIESTDPVEEAAAETEDEEASPDVQYELQEVEVELLNPVTTDETGTFYLPEDEELIDFIFPSEINGSPVYVIGEGAFRGFDMFRTVVIPSSIEEIGADAFADCENLERIIFADRADTSELTLGENWCGEAEVEFGLVAIAIETEEPAAEPEASEEPSEPTETPAEEIDPSEDTEEGSEEVITPSEPDVVPGEDETPAEEPGEDTEIPSEEPNATPSEEEPDLSIEEPAVPEEEVEEEPKEEEETLVEEAVEESEPDELSEESVPEEEPVEESEPEADADESEQAE